MRGYLISLLIGLEILFLVGGKERGDKQMWEMKVMYNVNVPLICSEERTNGIFKFPNVTKCHHM